MQLLMDLSNLDQISYKTVFFKCFLSMYSSKISVFGLYYKVTCKSLSTKIKVNLIPWLQSMSKITWIYIFSFEFIFSSNVIIFFMKNLLSFHIKIFWVVLKKLSLQFREKRFIIDWKTLLLTSCLCISPPFDFIFLLLVSIIFFHSHLSFIHCHILANIFQTSPLVFVYQHSDSLWSNIFHHF